LKSGLKAAEKAAFFFFFIFIGLDLKNFFLV